MKNYYTKRRKQYSPWLMQLQENTEENGHYARPSHVLYHTIYTVKMQRELETITVYLCDFAKVLQKPGFKFIFF